MKKTIKRMLASTVSAAILATSLVIPAMAEGETTSPKSWKFDFGPTDSVAEGYTAVDAKTTYIDNGYGFLGIGEKDHLLTESGRMDSFATGKDQITKLVEGSRETVSGVNDDYVATPNALTPMRFSAKVENGKYYTVKVTVTGADQSKDTTVTLFSEKRHPIASGEKLAAGESKTYTYNVDVQTIYYEKSEPKGNFVDDSISVVVVGDNTAISSIEINEHETAGRTLWVLGDSTVCDQGGYISAPNTYFPLQNFAGVGQALSKFISPDIAVSNHGEGGLNANDNLHFNNVKNNIKAGDYMFVEYGHNHKDDGPSGYLAALPKYYEAAHAKGAKLIVVGPIDRRNTVQFDATTGTWSSTLSGFSNAGRSYVEGLIANGADDVAFVDLNAGWLSWMGEVTAQVKEARGASVYEADSLAYYYTVNKYGVGDMTHISDWGAERAAYIFFQEAAKIVSADGESVQAKVLAELVDTMTDNTPLVVSDEIIKAGPAPNKYYPEPYIPAVKEMPVLVKDVMLDENNVPTSMTVQVKGVMATYGRGIVAVYNEDKTLKGVALATDQIDNSTGNGTQEVHFSTQLQYNAEAGDLIRAYVWGFEDKEGYPLTYVPYSPIWEPTDIDRLLLTKLDGNTTATTDIEKFADVANPETSYVGVNDWKFIGSAGLNSQISKIDTDGSPYLHLYSDGSKGGVANQGSFFFQKELLESVKSGRLMLDFDVRYISGEACIVLTNGLPSGYPSGLNSINISTGTVSVGGVEVGKINPNTWQHIRYVVDMDYGKQYVSINGGETVEADLVGFQTTSLKTTPEKVSHIGFVAGTNKAMEYDVANLTVAMLKQQTLPERTLTVGVAAGSLDMGTVEGTTTATMNEVVTATAIAKDGYELEYWLETKTGKILSYSPVYALRLHNDVDIVASFKKAEIDNTVYLLNEKFNTLSTSDLLSNGWKSPNAQGDMTIASDSTDGIGNYLRYGANSSSRGATKEFTPILASESALNKLVFSIDTKFTTPSGDPNQLTIHSGNIAYYSGNVNYGCSGGYILDILQTNNGKIAINGQEISGLSASTWFRTQAVLDFTNYTAELTVTLLDGTEVYTGTVNFTDTAATGINGVYFKFGKQNGGSVSMDNIKVFTAEQLVTE